VLKPGSLALCVGLVGLLVVGKVGSGRVWSSAVEGGSPVQAM